MRRTLTAAAALLFGIGVGSANATVIDYSLDQYTGNGTPPAGPYGTVELNDHGGPNVEVKLTLAAGEGMVNTGAGEALTWALTGNPLVTIAGLTSGFTVKDNAGIPTANMHLDGTGHWNYVIDCPDAVCSSGGSHPYTGVLDFTINNVALTAFTKNDNGFYFGTDICTLVGINGGCSGITGDIASDKLAQTRAPEPISLTLLGTGLLGLGIARSRRS